ncbi:M48 family metalloprotease [Ramlibacter albus]|uniref:M48 family metalloprotease n=1 Tax=Ramlibacter albus TaxID=2079448 RepID=A0A923S0V8_9BURK|nr:M48 family metalloprotease [Ramlibacter albus]MBC5763626.1 M48 family metalloprotease [Ramlibacter albus]
MTAPTPSRRRKWTPLVLALVLAAHVPGGAQQRGALPGLGSGDGAMTTAAERKLGERVARELFRDPDYIDDPVVSEYVQKIWQPLLAAARSRGELTGELDDRFAWRVLLGKDRSINAFAVPGGWLGLHMGLIAVTQTQDELASVLAHELSHVTQRHISRMIEQEGKTTPLMIGAMILGAIAASKNPQVGQAMIAGGSALGQQLGLNFSRDMEREADRIGYGVATQAGYEPQGFVNMFDRLYQASRHNDSGNFPYLRTHPLTTERIAEMQARQPLAQRAGPLVPTMEHAMIAARARVVSNSGVDALRAMMGEADASNFATLPQVRQAAVLYGSALAASRLKENAAAGRLLTRLKPATAGDAAGTRLARLLAAEAALAAGDAPTTIALTDVRGAERPEVLLLGEARLAAGRAADAVGPLQTWVTIHGKDGTAWQLLGRAFAAQGQQVRAIRADAESQASQLDYQAALDRLRAAQDLMRKGAGATDHIEASIIDTRARQIQLLLREQTLER